MAAYVVVDIAAIHDAQLYADYRQQVSSGVRDAGGMSLARGGEINVLEGDWHPSRIVVVRFDSTAAARRWWTAPEYAELKRMRQASTRTNMIVVDGCEAGEKP